MDRSHKEHGNFKKKRKYKEIVNNIQNETVKILGTHT